jgi:hypothetical protein
MIAQTSRSRRWKAPKTPKPPKTPRVRRKPIAALKGKLTPKRATPVPVDLRKRELVAVTALAALAVLSVAAIGFVISYSHMHDWALANHEPDWRAKLFPLSVDGAILAATLVLYADSRAGRKADKLAYFITALGIAWSVGANIGHTWVSAGAAMLIAGWPPVAMALSVEQLLKFLRRWRGQADAEVRKAAKQRTDRPAAEPDTVEVAPKPVPAPRPKPSAPKQAEVMAPHVVPMEVPSWVPTILKAGDACQAYLTQVNPDAEAPEVDREVGKYIRMSDGYARRQVRVFNEARQAAGQGG